MAFQLKGYGPCVHDSQVQLNYVYENVSRVTDCINIEGCTYNLTISGNWIYTVGIDLRTCN